MIDAARRLGPARCCRQAREWQDAACSRTSASTSRRASCAAPRRHAVRRARPGTGSSQPLRARARRVGLVARRPRGSCRCSASCAAGIRARDRRLRAATRRWGGCAELPVQMIKVDRVLPQDVPARSAGRLRSYSAILRLADACGCDVVAEGVEDAAQADRLPPRLPARPGLPPRPPRPRPPGSRGCSPRRSSPSGAAVTGTASAAQEARQRAGDPRVGGARLDGVPGPGTTTAPDGAFRALALRPRQRR